MVEDITRRNFNKKLGAGLLTTFVAPKVVAKTMIGSINESSLDIGMELGNHNYASVRADDMSQRLLTTSKGIFIGESHDAFATSFNMLFDNLEKFYKNGVRVIGLEHIDAEDQMVVDAYYMEQNEDTREALKTVMKWEVSAESTLIGIEKARKIGIKIIGVDTAMRKEHGHGLTMEDINTLWANAMEVAMDDVLGKFVVYGGFLHSSPDGDGVNTMLEIPSINPINPNSLPIVDTYFSIDGAYCVLTRSENGQIYDAVKTLSFNRFCVIAQRVYSREDEFKSEERVLLYRQLSTLLPEGDISAIDSSFSEIVDIMMKLKLQKSYPTEDAFLNALNAMVASFKKH